MNNHETIKKVAEILRNSIRAGDNVYRLAGDEFILVYCSNETQIIIQRINQALAKENISVSEGFEKLQKGILSLIDKKMYKDKKGKRQWHYCLLSL